MFTQLPPAAWSQSGIYGVPNLNDPNAVGPLSWNLLTNGTIPQSSVGNLPIGYPAQTANINHRFSWYDLGPSSYHYHFLKCLKMNE